MDRHLLVLDLDETLLHATEAPLRRAPDLVVPPFFIYRRPGLAHFIAAAHRHFDLAVWTSSSPRYAAAVCQALFDDPSVLSFVWAGDRCTPTRDFDEGTVTQSKRLAKLRKKGYDLDRVLVVDDSPEKHTRNYGNLVQIAPYLGDEHDAELAYLGEYLEELARAPNVRVIEKRLWRRRFVDGDRK